MKICVIGAGASGMMAAGTAAKNGADVTLIDGNEKIGKKIFITGKGRCNLTNYCDSVEFFENVITNPKFLMSAYARFSSYDTFEFFSNYTELKVERGNRVFPKSDKSSDIIKAMQSFLQENKVNLVLNTKVLNIKNYDNRFCVITKNSEYIFDKIIIATGGKSYSKTGSCGDGYQFAKNLGHKIIDIKPALVPVECDIKFIENLAGLTLKNVTAKIIKDGKTQASEFGEMLFTHTGVSGPIILSLSSKINRVDLSDSYISLDLKPALTYEELDARILRDFEKYNKKLFKNALDDLLPKSLIPKIIEYSKIDENREVNSVTVREREKLADALKNFKIKILSLGSLEEAIITSGGVDIEQINPKTMESKLVEGLYFCGEVINCDALTGGFNMQIAFSTGYSAGYFATNG